MTEYLLLFVGTVLVNNFVLVKFLGLCPFLGVSKKLESAIGMGMATTFVMTLASVSAWVINTFILVPLDLVYLRTLSFILVIAVVVQFTEMVVRKTSPALYRLLGIFLPLITTNCAVLGVALLNVNLGYNFLQSAVYGFSAAAGFSLVMVLFAAIRERLAVADVPAPFRGSSIALITRRAAPLVSATLQHRYRHRNGGVRPFRYLHGGAADPPMVHTGRLCGDPYPGL